MSNEVTSLDNQANVIDWSQATVIVGAGPVGFRLAQLLRAKSPELPIILLGNEPYKPYDRVRLSTLLAGTASAESLLLPLDELEADPHFKYDIQNVTEIDRDKKVVLTASNTPYPYNKLVLATGSRAHLPPIPGIEMEGVLCFRNMRDAEQLKARTLKSHKLVVIGGGLLGLEAAKAMNTYGTKVTLLQAAPILMNQQLDETAASRLQAELEAEGVEVITSAGIKSIVGQGRVDAVEMRNGDRYHCDTVLVSAGIRPNVDLARKSWLTIGDGIQVNNHLQTTDPDVYAIGECAEHEGKTYGLVGPGFEQASIVADHLCQGSAEYLGSYSVARLKVVGLPVFSMGDVHDDQPNEPKDFVTFEDDNGYRKLVMLKGKVVGAIAIGEWAEIPRVQEMITFGRKLGFAQKRRFTKTGFVWSAAEAEDPKTWPEEAVICNCNRVSRGEISDAIAQGCCSIADIAEKTGASSTCGTCKPVVQLMLGSEAKAEPESDRNSLIFIMALALAALAALVGTPGLPVATSYLDPIKLDAIWNDGLFKQITGFTLLALTVIGLSMSLNKRTGMLGGSFKFWRILHSVLAVVCLLLLAVHTGFHTGSNLNQLLLIDFLLLALLGAVVSVAVAMQYRFSVKAGRLIRNIGFWGHLVLSWPLPALLSFHILSVYYF
ncbi:MAG: FAD-dependent oxidoreductase [Pontibacterium sp.]